MEYECSECGMECNTVEVKEPFKDDAYGQSAIFYELYLYSECCGAEAHEQVRQDS